MSSGMRFSRAAVLIGAALTWAGIAGAQAPASAPSGSATVESPYKSAAPQVTGGGTDTSQGGTKGSGAGMPAGMAGSGAGQDPNVKAGAATGGEMGASATGAGTGAGATDLQATAGTIDATTAAAPVDKGPNREWLAEQNRASAKLREEQLAKLGGSGTQPEVQQPAEQPVESSGPPAGETAGQPPGQNPQGQDAPVAKPQE